MIRAVIHALAFVVVGILIPMQAGTYAAAQERVTTVSVRMSDVWATPATHVGIHLDHDDHGSVPCSHGACCHVCSSVAPCISVAYEAPTPEPVWIVAAQYPPGQLDDLRLELLLYRPPCAIA